MPEERAAPPVQDVNLEVEPLKLGDQTVGDWFALALVNQTFWNYEVYRGQNHDKRWNNQDSLYCGWIPTKYWEGSNVPRSNWPWPITFDQIEASLPQISQALFSDPEWFDVEPEPGSDPNEAKQIKDNLLYNLEHNKDDYGCTARTEIELAIKDLLLHGNGGVCVEWNAKTNRPIVYWVDLRDVYVDPGNKTPNVDEGRGLIWRRMLTVDELDGLRDTPGMKIPERAVLVHMAKNMKTTQGDETKRTSEAIRGVNYNPQSSDWVPNPADRKIEVLVYYDKNRIIWVLNREVVAFNEKNPYGFIPFAFAPCYVYLGRFYAMSMADVNESNQRTVEGLINLRLDELNMSLQPPRIAKAGSMMTPTQQRWRPGSVSTVQGEPDKSVSHIFPQNATGSIWQEVAFMEQSSEKRTGINSMSQGVPRPGNANRTATGVRSQLQGSMGRLVYLVSNIENYLIVPLLFKMYRMMQVHTESGQQLPARNYQYGTYYPINAEVYSKPVRFRMVAASRMLAAASLQQSLPFLLQYFLNGAFVSGLNAIGKTVDFDVLTQMIQDAAGTGKKYPIVRPLNQQEQQALQQPPPEAAAEMQRMQMEGQQKEKEFQLKAQETQSKVQAKQQEAEIKVMLGQMELKMKEMEMQLEAQKAQMELQMEGQKHQFDMQTTREKHQLDMQVSQQQAQDERQQGFMDSMMQARQSEDEHQLAMKQTEAAGSQKLEHDKMAGKQKLDLAKKTAQVRSKNKASK